MLRGAARPVIVAGGGIKNTGGHEAALALAEALNAPIITAPGHGDAIPFGHPLNAGQMGPRGNAVASRLAKEADVILALGTRLGFNSTFYSYDNINQAAGDHSDRAGADGDRPLLPGRPRHLGRCADGAAQQLTDDAMANLEARAEVEAWTEAYKRRTHGLSGKTRRRRRDRRPPDPAVGSVQGAARRPAQERGHHHGCGNPVPSGHRCA